MFSALARKQKESDAPVGNEPKKARQDTEAMDVSEVQRVPQQQKSDEPSDHELVDMENDVQTYDKGEEEDDLKRWLLTIDSDTPGEGPFHDSHPIKVSQLFVMNHYESIHNILCYRLDIATFVMLQRPLLLMERMIQLQK